MATATNSLNLRKPAGGDTVSVSTDLNANYDVIDGMHYKGSDVASASSLAIGDEENGAYRDVTGTTGVTAVSSRNAGQVVRFQFDGAVTLTHNSTSLILPGGSDYTTVAGDVLQFVSEGSGNWRMISGTRPPLHLADATDLHFGTGDDAVIRWSTGDSSNHALAIGLGDSNQGLHVTDKAAIATDWNISTTTHPNLYVHSNTTPATDYLRLGGHDGTTAYIDLVGGTNLDFQIAGTSEMELTATILAPSTSDGLALGSTSLMWGDLFLASGGVANFNNGDMLITHSSNTLTVSGGTFATAALTASTITGSGVLSIDDTTAASSTTSGSIHTDGGLGVAGDIYGGDDLFLSSSGAVVNFNAGDMLITHSSNTLTVSGGTFATAALTASTVTGSGVMSTTDATEATSTTAASLKTAGGIACVKDIYAGDDIFFTSGAVLNFNSGDVTVTHSANTITVTGGIMALDTASTIGNLTLGDGSITDSSGAIGFGNENLSTTGTLSAAATTITGTLDAESYMAIGNGSAVNADQTLTITRDFTVASGTGYHLRIDGQITAAEDADVFHVNIDSSTVTSGTNDKIATLNIDEPNISGGGAVTHAATVRISGVPTEGTSINAALWVDAGMLLADGGINIVSASDNNKIHTSSTGGGASTLYIGNTSITTSSDSRIKHNIQPANISALDTIRPLELKKFNWDDPTDTAPVNQNARGDYYGFMAQDTIKEVPWIINAEDRDCPECLAGVLCREHETFWKVEYQHMVPLLTAAIQELEAKVRQLEGDA